MSTVTLRPRNKKRVVSDEVSVLLIVVEVFVFILILYSDPLEQRTCFKEKQIKADCY